MPSRGSTAPGRHSQCADVRRRRTSSGTQTDLQWAATVRNRRPRRRIIVGSTEQCARSDCWYYSQASPKCRIRAEVARRIGIYMGTVTPGASDFDHFLLTRFNTRLGERATDEWLRHRIGYFESLCRHSIINQTNKNFRWLIYFDAERDEWFQGEVDRLSAEVVEPRWVDGARTPEKAAAAVQERATAPWVSTTRVDTDDALARDFVEAVQAQFGHEDHQFINFQAGLQLSDNGELYHRSDPSGPFISLIERKTEKPINGVYMGRHDQIGEYGPIRQVVTHPMWLQMVHGLNIGNALRGIRASPEIFDDHFNVELKPAKITKLRLRAGQFRSIIQLTAHVLRKPHRILWVFRVVSNRLTGRSS